MNKDRIDQLHRKFVTADISEEELLEWQQIVQEPESENRLHQLIEQTWNDLPDELLTDVDKQKANSILLKIISIPHSNARLRPLWSKLSIAAAILIILFGIGTYFFEHQNHTKVAIAYNHDIAPGRIAATLTLADGRKIKLDDSGDGKLAVENGVKIMKDGNGQLTYEILNTSKSNASNTLSTFAGETYRIKLPDGSLVWLNSASSLTYHCQLTNAGKREVKLQGEAYFEVAKDSKSPFIVETHNQKILVLGTHFNVNSYKDDGVSQTTLLEGRVEVTTTTNIHTVLQPGEQAKLENGRLKVDYADVELATAWKNNKFSFESASIIQVMKMIERWYDVEAVYKGDIPTDKFGGSVSKFENISEVLQILESTHKVHFKIEGRRIYVSK